MELPHVGIDFESFYNKKKSKEHPEICTIRELGDYEYCDKTDIYLVAIYDGEQTFVGHPADFDWKSLKGRNCVSHNALFEQTCYNALVRKKIISKIPRIGWWNCTANMSVYFRTGRALANASKWLLGEEISKQTRENMDGLTVTNMKALPSDKPECVTFYDEVVAYGADDAVCCWRLWDDHAHKWPEMEKRLSLITIASCIKGLPINKKYVRRGIDTLERKRHVCIDDLPWMNDMSIDDPKPGSPICLAMACRDAGIDTPPSTAKEDEGFIAWNEKHGETITWVKSMKEISSINIMLAKFRTAEKRVLRSGRFPYGMKYWGGHTGRWSGDKGFSVHGMEKKDVVGVSTRKMIQARKGKKLIIADKTQIEARITPFLAGDTKTIAMMHEGMSPYVVHAINTLGWDPGVDIQGPNGDSKLYSLAKARVLGLGFQCGAERFITQARTYGVKLNLRQSKATVDDFRSKNPEIVQTWARLHDDLQYSAINGDRHQVEIPSGRCLEYFDLKRVNGKFGKGVEGKTSRDDWDMKNLYGGLLMENAVQATARDVFSEDLIRLDDASFEILFHTHDEVVLHVDKSVTCEEIDEIMAICPDWLEGCPVSSDVVESDFYLKT